MKSGELYNSKFQPEFGLLLLTNYSDGNDPRWRCIVIKGEKTTGLMTDISENELNSEFELFKSPKQIKKAEFKEFNSILNKIL